MADKSPGESVEETRENQSAMDEGDEQTNEAKGEDQEEITSTISKRGQVLRSRKKASKTRLTKARNRLGELIQASQTGIPTSKTTIRRATKKVTSEFSILGKIIDALKEAVLLAEDEQETDNIIESLDKEFEDITSRVDAVTQAASDHLHQRINTLGEEESEAASMSSAHTVKSSEKDNSSVASSQKRPSVLSQRQQDADEAEKRLDQFEEKQRKLEEDPEKYIANVELGKRRTEDARRVAALNRQRAEQTIEEDFASQRENIPTFHRTSRRPEPEAPVINRDYFPGRALPRMQPVKLKGVELPTFSGENKMEFESWKAAFMSVVDSANISPKEKMLRLQACLTGKALKMVKDLGYSENAYKRAIEKLDKKYGGERRLAINLLTSLRTWPKLRRRNLEDMEDFLTVLDKILVAVEDNVELKSQHLNLTAKEKLSEDDIQSYKYWVSEHSDKEDCFEALVEWIEMRIRIMDEAKEEASSEGKGGVARPDNRRNRGFNTSKKPRGCVVESCQADHPPWVCQMFKSLPVTKRKELIAKSGRCFRCLASGHHSRSC